MAELNFGLLTPPGSQSIGNAFTQGMDQAAAARAQENQNAMAQYTLGKAQREDAQQNELYNAVRQPGFKLNIGTAMRFGAPGLAAFKAQEEAATRGVDLQIKQGTLAAQPGVNAKTQAQTDAATAEANVKKLAFRNQGLRDMANNPSDANIVANHEDAVLQGMMTPEQSATQLAELLKLPLEERKTRFQRAGAAAPTPEVTPSDIRTMRELGYPNTPAGYTAFRDAQRQDRLLTPAEEAQKVRIAGASRAPAAPRPEQPPVAVVDATGKTVYVSREEALRNRMTPANAGEGLPPKEMQKREAAFPQATSAVKGFETKSDTFIKDLEKLRDHPGLSSITGIAAGRLPGLTSDGRAAQALYDKVVAKGGFQALQDLRDASKTGGALGNVSNQEGKQLTASFAAIDRRQDALNVQETINQAIADIQGARTRTREAYDSTYSYKNPAGRPAGAPAGGGVVDFGSLR